MFDKKLKAAVEKYLSTESKTSKSAAKGAITKLVNTASAMDAAAIPDILQEFKELPNWLKLRFSKGSLYQEGDLVFGWYREEQVQAVELPVRLNGFSYDDGGEKMRVVKYIEVISEEMGFAPAIALPFDGCCVKVAPDDDNFWELTKAGYASPCDLQWSWFERPRWSDKEGYVVERSIIGYGFWQAWKWWPECWQWYLAKRPELFADAEIWQTTPTRYEPPTADRTAAVLGNASRHREIFYLDGGNQ